MSNIQEAAKRLEPLEGNVIFHFLDDIGGKQREFRSRATESGILLSTIKDEQKAPRWAQVIQASKNSDLETSDYILVQGLMWTNGTKFAGQDIWKTDEDQILMYTKDVSLTYGATT